MGSLTGTMNIAISGMMVQQAGIRTAANNLANVNTPGYSRQRIVVEEEPPVMLQNIAFGNGALLTGVESVRDRILELRLQLEQQNSAGTAAYSNALQSAQALFQDLSGGGLSTELTKLFDAFSQLSSTPSSTSARQGVLTAAGGLAAVSNRLSSGLSSLRTVMDQQIGGAVQEVNDLTAEIARLNEQIQSAGEDNSGALVDKRNLLTQKLSGLMGLTVVESESGPVLQTWTGRPLVIGGKSFALDAARGADGMLHLTLDGADVTSEVKTGTIGGLLRARDVAVPEILSRLDTFAEGLAAAVNAVHRAGIDLRGNAGQDLFSFTSGVGAAATLKVALTDAKSVVASQDGTVGDNRVALALSALRNSAICGGQTPTESLAALVYDVGDRVRQAGSQLEAEQFSLQQLQSLRDSVSAPSLDQEAADLIRFQRAFQASARVITVIDELTQTTINMARS